MYAFDGIVLPVSKFSSVILAFVSSILVCEENKNFSCIPIFTDDFTLVEKGWHITRL